jgi:hypothetical protein
MKRKIIHVLVGCHIYKKDTVIDSKAFKFFLYFGFEFRKSRTIKGIQCTSFNVQPCAQIPTKNICMPLAKTANTSFQLFGCLG